MAPQLLFGCANVGMPPWSTVEDVKRLATILQEAGIKSLDTAARYPPTNLGLSEKLIGQADLPAQFDVGTKILVKAWDGNGSLKETAIDQSLKNSLESLGVSKVNVLYCHCPDRETPLVEQAQAFDKHYRNGAFDKLGVSNIDMELLKSWLQIAEENNFVKPSIYQGQYNLLCRSWESDVLPLLRKHGIHFSAFSPLAGGFLTGKVTFGANDPDLLKGSRFEIKDDPSKSDPMGKAFRNWYDKESMHEAINKLHGICKMSDVSLTDASLRWLAYHSPLEDDDQIVFGASVLEQVTILANAIAAGPLPANVAEELNGLWDVCKDDAKSIVNY